MELGAIARASGRMTLRLEGLASKLEVFSGSFGWCECLLARPPIYRHKCWLVGLLLPSMISLDLRCNSNTGVSCMTMKVFVPSIIQATHHSWLGRVPMRARIWHIPNQLAASTLNSYFSTYRTIDNPVVCHAVSLKCTTSLAPRFKKIRNQYKNCSVQAYVIKIPRQHTASWSRIN